MIIWCVGFVAGVKAHPELVGVGSVPGDRLNELNWMKAAYIQPIRLDVRKSKINRGSLVWDEEFFVADAGLRYKSKDGKLPDLRMISPAYVSKLGLVSRTPKKLVVEYRTASRQREVLMAAFSEGIPLDVEVARIHGFDVGRVSAPPISQ